MVGPAHVDQVVASATSPKTFSWGALQRIRMSYVDGIGSVTSP
jgi:hypothetical protein